MNLHNGTRLKAIACIVIEEKFALNDILIIQANNRLCVEFPKSGKGFELFVPLSKEARKEIESAILKTFVEKTKNQ